MTCPNCGRAVPEGQRFCGNCGADLQTVSTFRAAPGSNAAPTGSGGTTYDYDQPGYDYTSPSPRRPAMPVIWLVVAAVALVCLCCGLIIGGLGMYWLGPVPSAPTPPTPTPEALRILFSI